MDVKEKLIELPIEDALLVLREEHRQRTDSYTTYLAHGGKGDPAEEVSLDALAMAISALEKTKWISVKDKLPEVVSIHKGYRSTVKKSIRVLCVCVQKSGKTMVKEGYCEWYNDYQEPRWQIPGTIDEVTHWQYLPHPPKGE